MSTRKEERELATKLAALDFELMGHTGSGHLLFRHPRAGTLVAAVSASDHRAGRNTIAQARRMIRLLDSHVGAFLTYLRLTYDVPRRGHKDMALNLSDEVRTWLEREHISGITAEGIIAGVKGSPFYEPLASRKGHRSSLFRLYGRDGVLEDVPELVEADLPIRAAQDREHPTPAVDRAYAAPAENGRPSTLEGLDIRELIDAGIEARLGELTTRREGDELARMALADVSTILGELGDLLTRLHTAVADVESALTPDRTREELQREPAGT
jgi:hypothetical protein